MAIDTYELSVEDIENIILTTAMMMGTRSSMLGGVHLHELFGRSTNTRWYRLAEITIIQVKLNYSENVFSYLQILMPADVMIVVDEAGQLSSEQLSVVNAMMMKLRQLSKRSFGDAMIILFIFDPE